MWFHDMQACLALTLNLILKVEIEKGYLAILILIDLIDLLHFYLEATYDFSLWGPVSFAKLVVG